MDCSYCFPRGLRQTPRMDRLRIPRAWISRNLGDRRDHKAGHPTMIGPITKIPLFMLYRRFGWPKMLPINLTLSPSPRCNSRCLTCNIWMKREDELTLEE